MALRLGNRDIDTRFPYLARDVLYQEQKPFATDFIPKVSDEVRLTNHIFDFMDLVVADAQPSREKFSLDEHGFCFLKSNTALTSSSASDSAFVEGAYYAEIEAALHRQFPEYTRLDCLDHQVRKRSHLFPGSPGAVVKSAQPAVLPHTDFSIRGCYLGMEHFFPGQQEFYKDRDFDILKLAFHVHLPRLTKAEVVLNSVWRVLKGPNNDWPLAVCDYQSIDPRMDVLPNDVLHEDCVGENWLLQKSSRHKWYYLSDQRIEDLIIFRNVDSKSTRPTTFHAAFDSGAGDAQPRESIEIRVVAFR